MKIEDRNGIISTFINETKIDVNTAPEVKGNYAIISTFMAKKKKNTEERKIKGVISTLAETKKNNFG